MIEERTGVSVRWAQTDDAPGLAAVCYLAWQDAYRGIIPARDLDHMLETRNESWWRRAIRAERRMIVLTVADEVSGYATCGRARRLKPGSGEVFEFYLTPVCQGIGLGQYLFEACRSALDDDGYRGLVVWALAANDRAQNFYWTRGGRPAARTRERFGPVLLEKTAFVWP